MDNIVLIKLDDYDTTHSTGGEVIGVVRMPYRANYGYFGKENEYYEYTGEVDEDGGRLVRVKPGYKVITTTNENVKVGWIYTDKTNQLIDSNVSTN